MSVTDLVAELRQVLPKILAPRPVLLAYLHGSLARGWATPLSDIDIALVLPTELPALTQLDLELDIEGELSAIGFPNADVRSINRAPLAVLGQVVTQGILLFCRDEAQRCEFEDRIRQQYQAMLPALNEETWEYIRNAVAELSARGLYRGS